ncbi:ABC transporter permease [Tabrizicola sp. WMC-M-20]|nr:ABC transporter permease [Tabrizicola sp. WMC-M-20]
MSAAADIDLPPLPPARASTARILFNHLAILFAWVGLWEFGSRMGFIDALFFPRPSDILFGFWRLYVTQGNVWPHLGLTMVEVMAGFVIGSAFGIALAFVVGLSDTLRRFLKPYIVVIEATPRIAIGPIVIAAFGFGWTSKIVIVTLVCFFAPFVNTLNGIINVDRDQLDMFRSLRATRVQTFVKLILPEATPEIMAGLRLAMASALGGALVAEFIASNAGMGTLISDYTGNLNMSSAFVCVLTLSALGYAILRGMEAVDRWLVFWSDRDRTERMGKRRALAWARLTGKGGAA